MLENLAATTVDIALLTVHQDQLVVLLHRRAIPPDVGAWALPGVFIHADEPLEQAAARALRDKTGLDDVFVEQLYTFGDPGRDPRGRVITTAYYALVPEARLVDALAAVAGDELLLAPVAAPPPLAFDHASIVATALERLRGKVGYAPVGYELLPTTFTLADLRRIHEAILGRHLNKDSFRRRLLDTRQVAATGIYETGRSHRPAQLFRQASTTGADKS